MSNGSWSGRRIVYLVEGDTEKKLVEALKTGMQKIYPGRVLKCNVTQERLKQGMFMAYGEKVSFAFIFDTDAGSSERLYENLRLIRSLPNYSGVICIPQVKNFEDELKYACNVKDVRILTNSRSTADFKRDFLRLKDISQTLFSNGFDILRMWCREPVGDYAGIKNEAYKIKKR